MSLEEEPETIDVIDRAQDDEVAMQVDADVPTTKIASKSNSRKTVQLPDGQPGTTTLPVARVQRIVKADKEIQMVNKEAIFALSVVTEHFIKRMTDKAYEQARMDQRKNVTLKDMSAIRNYPEFDFLSGIVPETVPLSVALAARAKKAAQEAEGPQDESTTTLADIMPKVPLFPSTDPEYPDVLIKKPPGGHAKKAKGVTEKAQAKGSKESTPVATAANIVSPSNHTSRNPVRPAQVGALPTQQESRPVPLLIDALSVEGSSGQGPLSGAGTGGGIEPDSRSRSKRSAVPPGEQSSRSDRLPAGTSSSSSTSNEIRVQDGDKNGSTTPLGFLVWSVSGIMASLAAYGWGGSFWRTKSIQEQMDDILLAPYMSDPDSGTVYGWDIKRLLFWWFVLVAFGVIAVLFNPNETSFRTYLNEQSFRKHLQGLHHQETGAASSMGKDAGNGHVPEESSKVKQPVSVPISSSSASSPSASSLSTANSSTLSTSTSTSPPSNIVTPTPFRFSNHIAVSLRTPQYHFLHSYLFSIVWILPGSAYTGNSKKSHSASKSTSASSGSLKSTSSSTTFGIDGEDHGEGYDPTLQGVWYLGAFGRWWNMGRIMDDPAIRPWSRKKKEVAAAAGEAGKREPGLISVVALPKDDRSPEPKTAPSTPLRRSSANTPTSRAESPPPLRADASLPLHSRTHMDSTVPSKASSLSTSHLTVPPPKDLANDPISSSPLKPTDAVKMDSPMLAELSSTLTSAQATVADLREQLNMFNSTVASSQAQLQSAVDELRRKKKDEDADRADLKVKMKHLEENKRQAESAKREAEKKLKSAVTLRDAVLDRCDSMQREMTRMREEMQEYEEAIKESKANTESHARTTGEAIEQKEEELTGLDQELANEVAENADLAAKVLQAAETLQALIDSSPQPVSEYANVPAPSPGEQGGLQGGVGGQQTPYSNRVYPFSYSFPDSYAPLGPVHATQLHQHHAQGATPQGQDFRSFSASGNVFRRTASGNVTTTEPPYRQSSPFRDISGYEGFGPLGAPVQGFSDGRHSSFLEPEEPGSPNVMSSSFTANLLPQGLFRSLEGDQTPQDVKTELDDPMDILDLDPANLELPKSPERSEDHSGQTPKPASSDPVSLDVDSTGGQGSKESAEDPASLQVSLDEASRKLAEFHDETEGPRPRRWFSSSKLKGPTEGVVLENGPAGHLNDLFGMPLAQTISNESLLVPGGGFDNNPFAPSAAEKRALRWGSIGKWAGGARQTSAPHEVGGPYKQHLGSLPNSARASSVDLNNNGARQAWEHAGPSAISSVIGAVPQEKRSFKLWSLGKKSAKEEPGSGSSIWN